MAKPTITINGKPVFAKHGETLIEAGLGGRILIPHDCCSGQCDTCRVRVVAGTVDDNGTADGDTVRACMATVTGDAVIEFEEVPPATRTTGTVTAIRPLSPDIVELVIAIERPLEYFPGQYVSVRFAGFPARDYSPTAFMNGVLDPAALVFHIKLYPGGVVSSQIGNLIDVGHRVRIRGPFGNAFLREPAPGESLVMVSAGTGWAPIWSVARAAVEDYGARDFQVIAGAGDGSNLYMGSALNWLREHGIESIVTTCGTNLRSGDVNGRPYQYLPVLGTQSTVYVAGGMGVVAEIETHARSRNARCYTDPFVPSNATPGMFNRLARAIRRNSWTSL